MKRIEKNQLDIWTVLTAKEDIHMKGTDVKTFTENKWYEIISCILWKSEKHSLFVVRNDFWELHNLPFPFILKNFTFITN